MPPRCQPPAGLRQRARVTADSIVSNNYQIIGDQARKLSGVLKRHGIRHEFHETEGGHTWINWRRYFCDLAQRLFRE